MSSTQSNTDKESRVAKVEKDDSEETIKIKNESSNDHLLKSQHKSSGFVSADDLFGAPYKPYSTAITSSSSSSSSAHVFYPTLSPRPPLSLSVLGGPGLSDDSASSRSYDKEDFQGAKNQESSSMRSFTTSTSATTATTSLRSSFMNQYPSGMLRKTNALNFTRSNSYDSQRELPEPSPSNSNVIFHESYEDDSPAIEQFHDENKDRYGHESTYSTSFRPRSQPQSRDDPKLDDELDYIESPSASPSSSSTGAFESFPQSQAPSIVLPPSPPFQGMEVPSVSLSGRGSKQVIQFARVSPTLSSHQLPGSSLEDFPSPWPEPRQEEELPLSHSLEASRHFVLDESKKPRTFSPSSPSWFQESPFAQLKDSSTSSFSSSLPYPSSSANSMSPRPMMSTSTPLRNTFPSSSSSTPFRDTTSFASSSTPSRVSKAYGRDSQGEF